MAQRFLVHEEPVSGPGTHAIVIGVGAYPHLNGGTDALTSDHDGMGQLSSPPISARKVASWLIESFANPEKPLSTVALLLSEATVEKFENPKTHVAYDVEPATADAASEAIRAWKVLGDTDSRNLMLFYFCGHGITEGTDTALLLADFGSDPNKALDGALDFRRLYSGLKRCRATEQCFFIDACRDRSHMLADADGFAGQVVIQPGLRDPSWERVFAPVFYASFKGAKAYGQPGEASLYSQALLKGLAGWGADDDSGDGRWRVTTWKLGEALENAMIRKSREFDRYLPSAMDAPNKIYLHQLPNEPIVPAYVKAEPPLNSIFEAALTYGVSGGAMIPAAPGGRCVDDWEIEASVGNYDIVASFPTGDRGEAKNISIRPPFRSITVRKVP
jgi:Caspase domain